MSKAMPHGLTIQRQENQYLMLIDLLPKLIMLCCLQSEYAGIILAPKYPSLKDIYQIGSEGAGEAPNTDAKKQMHKLEFQKEEVKPYQVLPITPKASVLSSRKDKNQLLLRDGVNHRKHKARILYESCFLETVVFISPKLVIDFGR